MYSEANEWASERTNERSEAREAEASSAERSECVSGASEWASGAIEWPSTLRVDFMPFLPTVQRSRSFVSRLRKQVLKQWKSQSDKRSKTLILSFHRFINLHSFHSYFVFIVFIVVIVSSSFLFRYQCESRDKKGDRNKRMEVWLMAERKRS